MSPSEVRYRMSVAGSFAGLVAWALGTFIPLMLTLPAERAWIAEFIDCGMIGLCIGGIGGAIAAAIHAHRSPMKLVMRAFVGALAGVSAGTAAVGLAVAARWLWLGDGPFAGVVLPWTLTGAFVGLALGLIRHGRHWPSVTLAVLGGTTGATVGATVLLQWAESIQYVTRAVGLMLSGFAICICSEFAVRAARKAVLSFAGSASADVGRLLHGQEWELGRRAVVLFGRNGRGPTGTITIAVADRHSADDHAWIVGRKDGFELRPHDRNTSPDGGAIWTLAAGSPPVPVRGSHMLCNGDQIIIGVTTFAFSSKVQRDKPSRITERLAAASRLLILTLALVTSGGSSMAASDRLAIAERPRLMRVTDSSEAPAFLVQLTPLDDRGLPTPVPMISTAAARQAVRVSEAGTPLDVCYVSLGTLPRRLGLILVDVSGSMLEAAGGGPRKIDVVKRAARRFAGTFEDGLDRMAIVPFHSRGVSAGVRGATFLTTRDDVLGAIDSIPEPSSGNTALYTAVIEAIARLEREHAEKEAEEVQRLLIVLTDGRNDVRRGDDPDLETKLETAAAIASASGLQIITIGFGRPDNLNETALRDLASPSIANYLPAERPEQVLQAFERARALQINRLIVGFRPQQTLLSQLVSPHTYLLEFESAQVTFTWRPQTSTRVAEGLLTACAAGETFDWPFFLILLSALMGFHWALWVPVPAWLWREWHDRQRLRAAAETLWRR